MSFRDSHSMFGFISISSEPTTNSYEYFHGKLNSLFRKLHHPNMYLFKHLLDTRHDYTRIQTDT